MKQTKYPGWMSEVLPQALQRLDSAEGAKHVRRFANLTEVRTNNQISLPWPTSSLRTVATQDGFVFSEKNGENIEAMLRKHCPSGVVFWASFDTQAGHYRAVFDSEVRDWISRDLLISPVSVLGIDSDIVLIIDDILSFTLIGAPANIIEELESLYGGTALMRKSFMDSLADYYPDTKDRDYCWITKTVLPACNWNQVAD